MILKKAVLVVDDNKLNRSILCRILREDGCDTAEAENGQVAFDMLSADAERYSLVLLDIIMPVMDGYAFLKKMNETGMISYIPVIVTTGNDDEGSEIKCLEGGASDFLKKPYNAEMVRHRVRSLLRLWDNAAMISRLETDRLTGVYTKEFFYRHAEEMLEASSDERFSILFADIDDFKMINVRYGTSAGVELLKYLAEGFRRYVGKNGLCGRISGDTFVLLLRTQPILTQEEAGALLEHEFADAPVKGFRLKFGIYPVDNKNMPVANMCDRAKLALSTIKRQYGVYFAVYNDSMLQRAFREHQLADCMDEALETGQFSVYLQPKHLTASGKVAGAEALVRWNHPELGFISPGEFVPLFEQNGFISKLDFFMLDEVCRLLKLWRESGVDVVPISVNTSRVDYLSPKLPKKIASCVDSYGVPRPLIHIEITESAYNDNPQQLIAAVSELREMGFLIEMDDFGSGYSSLNMLSELPIDIIKLDMKFIRNGLGTDSKRKILGFTINLADWLHLPTVAEGVETKTEYEQLKRMGCTQIQGYFFSRPMPAADFPEYLRVHAREPVSED